MCKLKKVYGAITFFLLSGCSNLMGGTNGQLEKLPKSGAYTGSAYSNVYKVIATARGIISDGGAKFDLVTAVIDPKKNTVTNVNPAIYGRFQLNSQICFSGREEFNDKTTAFIVENCKFTYDTISGNYRNNLGDYGSLTVSLNH